MIWLLNDSKESSLKKTKEKEKRSLNTSSFQRDERNHCPIIIKNKSFPKRKAANAKEDHSAFISHCQRLHRMKKKKKGG